MKSDRWNRCRCRYWRVDPQIVRYSERPELWEGTDELFGDIWPEYKLPVAALTVGHRKSISRRSLGV